MALVKCPECGKKVSDQAPTCIHCGYPIQASSPYKSSAAYPAEHDRFRPGYKPPEKHKNDGYWMTDPDPVEVTNIVTIQKTSKTWKGLSCFGCLTSILGLVMVLVAAVVMPSQLNIDPPLLTEFSGAVILLGIAISVFSKIMAWWHHG